MTSRYSQFEPPPLLGGPMASLQATPVRTLKNINLWNGTNDANEVLSSTNIGVAVSTNERWNCMSWNCKEKIVASKGVRWCPADPIFRRPCRGRLPQKAVVCNQSSIISYLTKSCVFGTHKTTYKYLADICRASSPSLLAYSVSEHSASQASTLAHLSLWTLETVVVFFLTSAVHGSSVSSVSNIMLQLGATSLSARWLSGFCRHNFTSNSYDSSCFL